MIIYLIVNYQVELMRVVLLYIPYSSYNQEDSVIINRGSLHKGLFNTSYYKIYEGLEIYDKKKQCRRKSIQSRI